MTTPKGPKTHSFQAAVTRVLSLVINSLYSNKEVFLRELVSNASDALDHLRFRALTEPSLLEGEPLRIRIAVDEEGRTLTFSDNGIGMSEEELARNLGTVAHSGSRELIEKLDAASKADVSLIGQFGVGFYSAYLVADRVEVVTRAAGQQDAFRWSSDGKETFTIEPAERPERGTDVILHVTEAHEELVRDWRIRELVKRYSDYVEHPIEMRSRGADEGSGEWEQVNEAGAMWQRSPSDITEEQYREFYKHLTHDWEDPLARRHFKIEGTQMFTGLLFVPSRRPFDLFMSETRHGVRLHVQRVFIMDDCEELLPRWLRFVRGVIDSEDLPLNVSRELLQDSAVVKLIRKQVVKQSLDMIEELAQGQDYGRFWSEFGMVLKEGLHFEPEHGDRLAKLVRWESSAADGLVSLPDYVARMKPGQEAIYYVFGPSRDAVRRAPHLEALTERGYEVLLMTDAIDQWAVQGLEAFDAKPLVSVMDADLRLEPQDASTGARAADEDQLAPLLKRIRQVLQDHVTEVRLSDRLRASPVCLVLPKDGIPPYLERLLRLQQHDLPLQKRILEVNPRHAVIESLSRLNHRDESDPRVGEWIELLHDQALLAEGSPVEDPVRLATRVTALLAEVATHAAQAE